jgi:hypothetical protein
MNVVGSEIGRIINCGGGSGSGGGWGWHWHCCHHSSFCVILSVLQNSNFAVFIYLNIRHSMLLWGRNVKCKLYKCMINFY